MRDTWTSFPTAGLSPAGSPEIGNLSRLVFTFQAKGFTLEISTRIKHETIAHDACALRHDQAWSLRGSKPWNRSRTTLARYQSCFWHPWNVDPGRGHFYLSLAHAGTSLENHAILLPSFALRIPVPFFDRVFTFSPLSTATVLPLSDLYARREILPARIVNVINYHW